MNDANTTRYFSCESLSAFDWTPLEMDPRVRHTISLPPILYTTAQA